MRVSCFKFLLAQNYFHGLHAKTSGVLGLGRITPTNYFDGGSDVGWRNQMSLHIESGG